MIKMILMILNSTNFSNQRILVLQDYLILKEIWDQVKIQGNSLSILIVSILSKQKVKKSKENLFK